MEVSVIIPTNRSRERIEPCLRALAAQTLSPAEVEVLVIWNGVERPASWADDQWPYRLTAIEQPDAHICAAKNAGLDRACGRVVVLINDDVIPHPEFLAAHLDGHARAGESAMVLGASPWVRHEDDTLFDELIASTSMVFFYDQLVAHRFYGFRHAWNLNLSIERRYLERERYDEGLAPVYFDDIEFAYRLWQRYGLRVWYHPEAVADHDHRYSLDGYLRRESVLGDAAAYLWQRNPACFEAIYGTDLTPELIAYWQAYVADESRHEAARIEHLRGMVERPLCDVREPLQPLLRVLYDAHIPLKRLAFRRAFLTAYAAHSRPMAVL